VLVAWVSWCAWLVAQVVLARLLAVQQSWWAATLALAAVLAAW
jgi:hypothetical protein